MSLNNEIDLSVEQLPQNHIILTPQDETDYNSLVNKPKINNFALVGNKTSYDLGLASAEQGAKADSAVQPSDLDVYRTATAQDAIDATKQDVLSATQMDAVNSGANSTNIAQIAENTTAILGKQDTLVSGTNIKTVNGNSLVGSGDISIDSLPSQTGNNGKFLTTDGSSASWAGLPDISGKANVSLDNLSSAGDIYGSKLGMPSSTFEYLTIGASGTTYTAPANGWVSFSTWSTATTLSYFQLTNITTDIGVLFIPPQGVGYQQKAYIPCRKGDTIYIAYGNLDMSRSTLKFIYAEGSKSEKA